MPILSSLLFASATTTLAAGDMDAVADDQARDTQIIVTGSRTEGSDDYAAAEQRTALRLPLSQKETPQSVSVVTRAQIDDFQLDDVNRLLSTVPGVVVLAAETDRVYYSARGFDIQTFQIDGVGLPFAFGIQTGSLDTAIYDRIEVVRGAPGLLSPTGNPSAVVNFVRKRPYRELATRASAQYGSFDHLRLDGDLSVAITANGSIRARGVGAYLDEDSHLDRYELTRWTGYGILEADVGPNTVMSGGYAHQDHRSTGTQWGAIPLIYTDGSRVEFARSANTGPEWARWGVVERQIFGDLTHYFGGDWFARLTVQRRATSEDDRLFYVYGNPDRATGDGIFSYPGAFQGETRNLTVDAHVGGKIAVEGREHDVLLGLNRGAESYLQFSAYDFSAVGLPVPLSELFDGTFPEPDFPAFEESLNIHTRQETAYGLVRLDLADPFKLMLGGNYTRALSEGVSYGTVQDYRREKFLPFVGATFDLTPTITAYASYATIFNPQTEYDEEDRLLDPIEGDTLEAGLKGEWYGGRLFASAAVFRGEQRNTAEYAGFANGRSFYRGVDATSEGIELEIAGSPFDGLQLTGGFATMRVRGADGEPARTFVPRTSARLNVTYSPPALGALKLGASMQYQSEFSRAAGIVDANGEPFRIEQGRYALVDLLARYDLTENVSLSANLRNVTNARYLSSLTFDQSYYGPPRAIYGTISVKY